jgi:hypothetical protein
VLPPKTTNTITSAVTIPDGEIFVIGGLTREVKSKSVSKVPIVGDIPIIGKLFRSESVSNQASNLYIFLRAHVLTHPTFLDGIDLTTQADSQVREFAPDIQYLRFQQPQVPEVPPEARDPDDARRVYLNPTSASPGRARVRGYSEGREAPQGPYESVDRIPLLESEQKPSYRGDPESPTAPAVPPGDRGAQPVPRGMQPPQEAGQDELPPMEPDPLPQDVIDPAVPSTPAPKATTPQEELDRMGLEEIPGAESWIVPVRPKGTAMPEGEFEKSGGLPGSEPPNSWLYAEKE